MKTLRIYLSMLFTIIVLLAASVYMAYLEAHQCAEPFGENLLLTKIIFFVLVVIAGFQLIGRDLEELRKH